MKKRMVLYIYSGFKLSPPRKQVLTIILHGITGKKKEIYENLWGIEKGKINGKVIKAYKQMAVFILISTL